MTNENTEEVPENSTEDNKDEPQQFGLTKGGKIFVGIGSLIVIGWLAINWNWSSDDTPDRAEIRTYCEIDVKRQLKAPSTAEFSYPNIFDRGENTWMVKGTVEAENSFGGRVTNDYECEITIDGDRINTSVFVY